MVKYFLVSNVGNKCHQIVEELEGFTAEQFEVVERAAANPDIELSEEEEELIFALEEKARDDQELTWDVKAVDDSDILNFEG